jgi:hypothetical protein
MSLVDSGASIDVPTTNTESSVADIQNEVDALVLSIFDAMRNGTAPGTDKTFAVSESEKIYKLYENGCKVVDNLIGINRSQTDQLEELDFLSKEYAATKDRILELERQLQSSQKLINEELQKALLE